MNLSKKLVLIGIATGALPVVALEIVTALSSTALVEERGRVIRDIAGDVGETIDRNLFERYGDVQAFAVNDVVRKKSDWYKPGEADNAIVRAMNNYVALYGMYDLMVFVDTEGKVIAASNRDATGAKVDTAAVYGRNWKDAPWFKAAAAGQFTTRSRFASEANNKANGTFVEDLALDPLAEAAFGKPHRTLGFTAPVRDGNQVIGYWTNRAGFAFVEEIVRDAQTSLDVPAHVEVTNGHGELLADIEPEGQADGDGNEIGMNVAKAGNAVARLLTEGKSGVMRFEEGHGERLAGYAVSDGALGFPGLDWGVNVHMDVHDAARVIESTERLQRAVGAMLVLLIAVAAYFAGRRMAGPIEQMAEVASKLAEGDVEQDVRHQGADEIGRLADSFRALIGYIKTSSAAIVSLGQGNVEIALTPRSERDVLTQGIMESASNVSYLVESVIGTATAAEQGESAARVSPGQLAGDYARLAQAINKTLDAVNAPVTAATHALERVAACDLTAQVDGDFAGDHARLKNALNTAVSAVRDALTQVSRGSEQVKAASSQIASGSQTLASGASEQAASLTQTRSVLETVSEMTGRNAESAQHANALAASARDSSAKGSSSMEQMIQAMTKIRGAVENTAQIIRDINQIAFQTNLLALNAAVEAARAGDAGRGFAVVADEVRNLAQQAKQAAHKTEELLQDSIRQAERGEALTQDVTKNLGEIVGSVAKVGEIIEEIATASREQAAGIEQVHKASAEMDQVTHQNAASSEELSSTAEELAAQAQELTGMVGRFKLGDDRPQMGRGGHLVRPRMGGAPAAPAAPAPMGGAQLIPFNEDVELRDF